MKKFFSKLFKKKEKSFINTKALNPYAKKIPLLMKLSKSYKIEPGTLLALVLSIILTVTFSFYGPSLLVMAVSLIYPMKLTIATIEDKKSRSDDRKKELTYWGIYGLIFILEAVLATVNITVNWVLKLAFFVYLLAPQTQGSLIIYESLVKPIYE